MGEHTPGPWVRSGVNIERIITADEHHLICDLVVGRTTDEADANCKLIAAAPELLKALKLIASIKREGGRYDNLVAAPIIAQKAIELVEGGEVSL